MAIKLQPFRAWCHKSDPIKESGRWMFAPGSWKESKRKHTVNLSTACLNCKRWLSAPRRLLPMSNFFLRKKFQAVDKQKRWIFWLQRETYVWSTLFSLLHVNLNLEREDDQICIEVLESVSDEMKGLGSQASHLITINLWNYTLFSWRLKMDMSYFPSWTMHVGGHSLALRFTWSSPRTQGIGFIISQWFNKQHFI